MILDKDTITKIELAFCMSAVYMLYIKEAYPALHAEADGSPSASNAIMDALKAMKEDRRYLN